MEPHRDVTVANFNIHAGVDGWGRPFDVLDACRCIDADVLVMEEVWRPEGATSQAEDIGRALGAEVVEHVLGSGRLAGPHPDADHRWMRPMDLRANQHALYLDGERPLPRRVRETPRFIDAGPGSWGIAILSRLPVLKSEVIELGRLPRDPARRAALLATVESGVGPLVVAGTHMTHLSFGSPIQFLRLARALDDRLEGSQALLAGDMNLWGPPLELLLRGWRRGVRGRTWPAWRPHSQVDHIVVRAPAEPPRAPRLEVLSGEVLADGGSDHRPVRVRVRVQGA